MCVWLRQKKKKMEFAALRRHVYVKWDSNFLAIFFSLCSPANFLFLYSHHHHFRLWVLTMLCAFFIFFGFTGVKFRIELTRRKSLRDSPAIKGWSTTWNFTCETSSHAINWIECSLTPAPHSRTKWIKSDWVRLWWPSNIQQKEMFSSSVIAPYKIPYNP